MILASGVLVIAGLGLFVGGLATGTTGYYWGCVACCAVAVVLLIAARMWPGSRVAPAPDGDAPAAERKPGAPATTAPATTAPATGAAAEEPAEPEPVAAQPAAVAVAPAAEEGSGGAAAGPTGADGGDDPGEEDVEVTDLLMVVDLRDQVLVVDEHPRYHLADCRWLRGRATIPLPVAEARGDGFTPCGVCRPDRSLADLARARKAADKR